MSRFSLLIETPSADFDTYLSSNGLDSFLKELLERLSEEQPTNPHSFIIEFLQNNKLETDEEMEEDEQPDIISDEIPKFLHNRKRRMAVSSEPNGEVESITMTMDATPKNEDTNKRLNEALSRHILCSHLDESERKEVFNHMHEITYQDQDVVIKQGDDGDKFYVVDEGELDIFVNNKEEGTRVLVQHVTPGGSFGELALIYDTPRAADVVAVGTVRLWYIDRVTYRRVLMDSTTRKRKLYEEFLDNVPILATLQKYERLVVADALEPVSFKEGEVVVKQGDSGDVFYIIIEGTAKVTQLDKELNEKFLVQLKPSDYFGEIALLTDRPRAATVTAQCALNCVRLDRARFIRVLGPCEDILRRNMEAYNKYMAKQI